MSTASFARSRPTVTVCSPKVNKVVGLALALAAGLGIAGQGRINGQLGSELHDSMLAAAGTTASGLLILVLASLLSPKMRRGVHNVREAVRGGTLKPWQCLGGIGGAAFVASQAITVGVLGVALFTVGVVAGQTVSGLFVDRAGLGPAGPQALTPRRVFGTLLMLAAVAGSLAGGFGAGGAQLWLFILPLFAGVLMAAQQAVNGRVSAAAQSTLTATLINFLGGTTVLVLGWLVSLALRGGPTAFPHQPVLYVGGLIGIFFIAMAALVVEWIGVLMLLLAATAGQLIGAVLLDVFVPTRDGHVTAATLIGTAVALVAVVVAAIPRRRAHDQPAARRA